MRNVVTPLRQINLASRESCFIQSTYLVALGNVIAQDLAFGAQGGIALLGAHESRVELIETVFKVCDPCLAGQLRYWLRWGTRLGYAWLMCCGERIPMN